MIRRIKGLLRSRMFKDRWKLFDSEVSRCQWISRTGMALVASVLVLSLCGVLFHSAAVQGSPDSSRNPRILLSVVQPTTTIPKTPVPLQLEDIFISVKTTKKNYASRLDVIIQTWFQLAKDHVWFFTDDLDPEYTDKTNGHLRATECNSSHSRQDLNCKMNAEIDGFLESGRKWFCHFDDDNYVNVPALLRKLQEYDYREDWYIGKLTIATPVEILDRTKTPMSNVRFWFATFGAGMCLSQSLAFRMMPVVAGGKYKSLGDKLRLPDDVLMGYVAEHLMNTPLTSIDEFHSHYEPQKFLPIDQQLDDQISFSYSWPKGQEANVVNLEELEEGRDVTRFRSLHCRLFPQTAWCPRQRPRP